MSDTLPSVNLSGTEYQSVTALTGILAGTAISVQNQSREAIFIAISASKPSDTFIGQVIPPNPAFPAIVDVGENQVWLRGNGSVNIQEA